LLGLPEHHHPKEHHHHGQQLATQSVVGAAPQAAPHVVGLVLAHLVGELLDGPVVVLSQQLVEACLLQV
jgi:hypothetical protein